MSINLLTPRAKELLPAARCLPIPTADIARVHIRSLDKFSRTFTASPAPITLIEIIGGSEDSIRKALNVPRTHLSTHTTVDSSAVGSVFGFSRAYAVWQKEEVEIDTATAPDYRQLAKWRRVRQVELSQDEGAKDFTFNRLRSVGMFKLLEDWEQWSGRSMPTIHDQYGGVSPRWLNWAYGLPYNLYTQSAEFTRASIPDMAVLGWARCLGLPGASVNTHQRQTLF